MSGKLAISFLVLTIIVLAGLIFLTYTGKFSGPKTEQETNSFDNAGDSQGNDTISPMMSAKEIVKTLENPELSPEDVVTRSFEALDLVDGLHTNALSVETQFFTSLYKVLIAVYENADNSLSTRSQAVIAMNKVAYLSAFDPVPINSALIEFDNRRLYDEFLADPHTSDTPVGIAYKAWYEFSSESYKNSKDPYFQGFAVWTIALSLIANQPEAEWRDDFMDYIVNEYERIWPDAFDTKITQLDQVYWLQSSLLISRIRLENVYGEDVAYSKEDYQKRFQRIIDSAATHADPMILQLAKMGMLVMLQEKKSSPEEISAAITSFIESAEELEDDWFSIKNRTAKNEQGFLLLQLGEIAKTNIELKQFLEQKGWKL